MNTGTDEERLKHFTEIATVVGFTPLAVASGMALLQAKGYEILVSTRLKPGSMYSTLLKCYGELYRRNRGQRFVHARF